MRRSLVPSLLDALVRNRRQRAQVRLYEVGKGYLPEHATARGEPRELHLLGLVWAAPAPATSARFDADRQHALQGVVEDALRAAGYPAPRWERAQNAPVPSWALASRALVATLGASVDGSAPLGLVAPLDPLIARKLGLVGELACDVACAELSLDVLLASAKRPAGFDPIPKFPLVKVDVAVSIDAGATAGSVLEVLQKAGKGLAQSIELFDVYTGANLAPGRKSLAFHVLLRSDARTLTDQDVAKFLERVERELKTVGAELRRE